MQRSATFSLLRMLTQFQSLNWSKSGQIQGTGRDSPGVEFQLKRSQHVTWPPRHFKDYEFIDFDDWT